MVPRWSRLALAAILAFGASPGLASAAAAVDDGECCACEHDRAAGPSLVTSVTTGHVIEGRRATGCAPPLCAPAPVATAPRVIALVRIVDARPTVAQPGPRQAPWRVAPKTSPPR